VLGLIKRKPGSQAGEQATASGRTGAAERARQSSLEIVRTGPAMTLPNGEPPTLPTA
jgi:hypothetical protein